MDAALQQAITRLRNEASLQIHAGEPLAQDILLVCAACEQALSETASRSSAAA